LLNPISCSWFFDNEAPVAAPLNSDVQALDAKANQTAPAANAETNKAPEQAAKNEVAPATPAAPTEARKQ
jgi:hypothetical protein